MSRAAKLFSDEAMGYTAPVAKGAALGYPEQVGGVTDLLGARQELGGTSLEEQRYLQMGGAGLGNYGMLPGEEKPAPGAPSKLRQPQFGGSRKSRKARRAGRKSRKVQHGGRRRTAKQGRKPFLNLRVTGQIRLKQRHRQ